MTKIHRKSSSIENQAKKSKPTKRVRVGFPIDKVKNKLIK